MGRFYKAKKHDNLKPSCSCLNCQLDHTRSLKEQGKLIVEHLKDGSLLTVNMHGTYGTNDTVIRKLLKSGVLVLFRQRDYVWGSQIHQRSKIGLATHWTKTGQKIIQA